MLVPEAPIGVFDSGVGGLTVLRALQGKLATNLIYYGDTAHVPYGDKSPEMIIKYCQDIVDFLQIQGAKAVIIACNTATAIAVPHLQATIPIFGIIGPAIKGAVASTKNGRIGLLATNGTVRSGVYQQMIYHQGPNLYVIAQGCPKLVLLAEQGILKGPQALAAVRECLDPLLKEDIDTLILGCTHFPLFLPVIQGLTAAHVTIIDPAWQLAFDMHQWLVATGQEVGGSGQVDFWVSGDPIDFQMCASQILGRAVGQVKQHLPV